MFWDSIENENNISSLMRLSPCSKTITISAAHSSDISVVVIGNFGILNSIRTATYEKAFDPPINEPS